MHQREASRSLNQNFIKLTVFDKLDTFVFRSCGLKFVQVLDFRDKEGNGWKNGLWNTTILTKFPILCSLKREYAKEIKFAIVKLQAN